jgi:hypothetical protein
MLYKSEPFKFFLTVAPFSSPLIPIKFCLTFLMLKNLTCHRLPLCFSSAPSSFLILLSILLFIFSSVLLFICSSVLLFIFSSVLLFIFSSVLFLFFYLFFSVSFLLFFSSSCSCFAVFLHPCFCSSILLLYVRVLLSYFLYFVKCTYLA